MAKFAQYKERLLNEFELRNDEWTYSDFERRLGEVKVGAKYQDAKGIIITAHQFGRWPKTVKRYLFTHYKSFGHIDIEFIMIFNEIYFSISDNEKEFWGIMNI